TFYSWKHLATDSRPYEWIDKMEIIDEYTIDFFIDGNPETPHSNEPYTHFFSRLNTYILPEHYLNQTQLADGVTPDITHESWDRFATNCFGTSLFRLNNYIEDVETELTVWDDCWWLNETITADPDLNWDNRFGNKWEFDSWRIRIIPDQQTAVLEFEAGKVDIQDITIYPEKRDEFIYNPSFEVKNKINGNLGFFGYNIREDREYIGDRTPCETNASITKGLAIRKAISYALDRNEINKIIHQGEFNITDHPIYPIKGIWYNPDIIRYTHDLDKARDYMKLAGFEITKEGSIPPPPNPSPSIIIGNKLWIILGTFFTIGLASYLVRKGLKNFSGENY
ncbi:MAG: hypothetical protein EU542_08485, partial [Promethearchaeota archaeon]